MQELGDFLLFLYGAARELDLDAFQDVVLRQLQYSFPFASAFWGEGQLIGGGGEIVPTALFAQNLDPCFMADWTRANSKDPVLRMVSSNIGRALPVHVPSFYRNVPELVEIGRRYGIGSLTVTVIPGVRPQGIQWLSLFRGDSDTICSDMEKRWIEHVMPHLGEALSIHRALHAPSSAVTDARGHHVAVAEVESGLLLRADAEFLTLLSAEWTGFDGRLTPSPLLKAWQQRRTFNYLARRSLIEGRCVGDLVYLSGRRKNQFEALTQRQLLIADLYAQGLSYKEIAQRCDLSPATVRNHLAAVYATLGVHGKLEMAERIGHLVHGASGFPRCR